MRNDAFPQSQPWSLKFRGKALRFITIGSHPQCSAGLSSDDVEVRFSQNSTLRALEDAVTVIKLAVMGGWVTGRVKGVLELRNTERSGRHGWLDGRVVGSRVPGSAAFLPAEHSKNRCGERPG
jgi:hypothetical protein